MTLRSADHQLVLTGVCEGIVTFDIQCLHLFSEQWWYRDSDTGSEYDECIVKTWFDNEMTYIVQAVGTPPHPIPIWTHWNLDGTPQLLGPTEAHDYLEIEGVQP